MKQKHINNIFFACEISFYVIMIIVFSVMLCKDNISTKTANIIYIIYISILFGYLLILDIVFEKYDNAVHYKMLKKYYIPPKNTVAAKSYKRKGLQGVIILWILYLGFIAILKYIGLLYWQVFLIGANIMFILNSIFVRKKCFLSVLFLKNKNNCCKNCGINCWDYAIFASALIFAPKLSIAATILNISIIAISMALLIVWEYNYHKYPERFYPETNTRLQCKNCLKQCKSRKDC